MRGSKWIVASLAVGAALVAVWATLGRTGAEPLMETRPPQVDIRHAAALAGDAAPVLVAPEAEPGQPGAMLAGRHHLDYSVRLGREGGPVGSLAQVRLEADLELSVRDLSGETWLLGRVTSGRLVGATRAGDPNATSNASESFTGEVALQLLPSGAFGVVRFGSGVPAPVRATMVSALHTGMIVRAEAGETSAWQVAEDGVNATYDATYRVTSAGLEKSWLTRPTDGDGSPSRYSEVGSATIAMSGPRATAINSRQNGKILLGEADGTLEFDATGAWKRTGDVGPGMGDSVDVASMEDFDLERYASADASPQQPLSSAEIDALVAESGAAARSGRWQDRHAAGRRLGEAVVANGAEATRLAAMARTAEDEAVRRTLLEALASAGTPAAQNALIGFATDLTLAADARTQAFGAATFVQNPTGELLAALERAAYSADMVELPLAAAVTLGASLRWDLDSRHAAKSDVAERFSREAQSRLRPVEGESGVTSPDPKKEEPGQVHPTDPGLPPAPPPAAGLARREWTRAIGNAALPEFAPILIELLKDPDEYVRVAAAFSTRFYPPGPVLSQLPIVMAEDDSILVRAAIAQACEFLGPGPCETMMRKTLRHDPSVRVRQSAAYTVATWIHDTPAMAAVLEEALQNEKSPEVSETLQNYLTPGRVAYPFRIVAAGAASGSTP
jgi:HEAT repeat protein